ncbi:MAG: hypothetical protein R3E79_50760 [Caldilineaceae bacterium]
MRRKVILLGQHAQVKERDWIEARLKELYRVKFAGEKIPVIGDTILRRQLGDKGFGIASVGAGQPPHPT